MKATISQNLVLSGSHQSATGVVPSDGAVVIGPGSYYTCQHGIAPNGGGSDVNRWSILIDFVVPSIDPWYCFFQTSPTNANDGDCFVQSGTGKIGVGASGYSPSSISPQTWYRLVIVVDNGAGLYDIYLDGSRILLEIREVSMAVSLSIPLSSCSPMRMVKMPQLQSPVFPCMTAH
ncbi:MAG: hypothetical protein IPI28_09830 [Candidatus Omnitrophica bacterium]|nr:hypothetical protein [Candidatus Omnitrophota bacterium]